MLLQQYYLGSTTHMRTLIHTQKHCSWLSQREKLEALLLLYRGCVKVYKLHISKAGVLLAADTAAECVFGVVHILICGFSTVLLGSSSVELSLIHI